jgi:serine protease Do
MAFLYKMRQQKLLSITLMIFTLSVGIVIGTLINTGVFAAKDQMVAPDATPLVIPAATAQPNELAKLVKRLEPSVVNISTDWTQKGRTSVAPRGQAPDEEDEEGGDENPMDLFRRFFPDGNPNQRNQPQKALKREATGSGFVVDKNGYILTNNHVVEKADHIKVKIPGDDAEYRAKLIGVDLESDVAVIKIDAGRPLPSLKIGNSDVVQVGDTALAIGSPFGLETSVTLGIISAMGRDIPGSQVFQHFIQTDAAINPGNSGGPLLNSVGEVIGINTAIATQSGGYQGIGFALPSNMAVAVYNSIIRSGKMTRGSVGIQFYAAEKNSELMKALGLKEGVLVDRVMPGGPSEKAGMKPEDVIVAFNGKPIKDGTDLVNHVAAAPLGSTVDLTVDRGGKKLDLKVSIVDRETQLQAQRDPHFTKPGHESEEVSPTGSQSQEQPKFGISVRPLNDTEKEGATWPDKHGVVVTSVVEGSFAEDIGLQTRDVLVSINRQPVNSLDDVRKVQSTLKPGDAVAFRVMRMDQRSAGGRGGVPSAGSAPSPYIGLWVSGTLSNGK